MNTKTLKKSLLGQLFLITLGTAIIAIGAYFFKFPNNFSFGGVTGIAVVLAGILPYSPSTLTFIFNIGLLFVAYIFLGKQFATKTIYTSVLMSVLLALFDRFIPLAGPLTNEPFLEFAMAVFLAALGAAILFNTDASGGGTDILALVLKKYTGFSIGGSLFVIDLSIVIMALLVFDIQTGIFAIAGLASKSFVVNGVIESLNISKYFNIICDNPEPIYEYIHNELHRGATIIEGMGTFSHQSKYIIFTAIYPEQAIKLRNKVRELEPNAFIFIANSSEIIGRGFQSF